MGKMPLTTFLELAVHIIFNSKNGVGFVWVSSTQLLISPEIILPKFHHQK
ncbi:hypothetical protein [Bacillus niameyensis]|nr:hypothetical protein [Bacillus niameyensis]